MYTNRHSNIYKSNIKIVSIDILKDNALKKLRSEATLNCTKPKDAEPCNSLQQVKLYKTKKLDINFRELIVNFFFLFLE